MAAPVGHWSSIEYFMRPEANDAFSVANRLAKARVKTLRLRTEGRDGGTTRPAGWRTHRSCFSRKR